MLGRAAYQNPWDLAEADPTFFEAGPNFDDPHAVIEALLPYIEREISKGERLHAIARHILGLFQGRPGARAYRRHISENSPREGAGPEVIRDAAAHVPKGATRRDAA